MTVRPKSLSHDYKCELCGDVILPGQEVHRVTQMQSDEQFFLDTGTILHKACAASDLEAYKRKRKRAARR